MTTKEEHKIVYKHLKSINTKEEEELRTVHGSKMEAWNENVAKFSKNSTTARNIRAWNRLTREGVKAPPVGTVKTRNELGMNLYWQGDGLDKAIGFFHLELL